MTLINYVMRLMHKILFNLGILVSILILIYAFYLKENVNEGVHHDSENSVPSDTSTEDSSKKLYEKLAQDKKEYENINLWCIFTKVDRNSNLKYKFETFSKSILSKSTKSIHLNVITDDTSKPFAEELLLGVQTPNQKFYHVEYHNVTHLSDKLKRLVSIMSPHFSSRPGTYYSDALFFLSLGLHHIIAPNEHSNRAIMMDVDIKVVGDVAELWSEFDNFGPDALFGLGPELSPVYRHVFHTFRSSNQGTPIGEPLSEKGYPGVNSGVILLNLEKMRQSKIYSKFIGDDEEMSTKSNELDENQPPNMAVDKVKDRVVTVDDLVKKYSFRGHLGDQDFYTLLGAEYPELIHIIPCVWNRQLCTWWGDRGGYGNVFDKYFRCEGKIKIYHGNCNTPFPKEAD